MQRFLFVSFFLSCFILNAEGLANPVDYVRPQIDSHKSR